MDVLLQDYLSSLKVGGWCIDMGWMWIQRMVGERMVEVESACKGLYV
jgi:hypothetical protein